MSIQARRTVLLLLLPLVIACGPSESCDTAPYHRCAGGTIYVGGCGGESIVAQCARGCDEEGMYAGYGTCPFTLCHENQPKNAGDSCQTAVDCAPTQTNTYLACDAGAHACVATDAPVVADWLQPCSPDLIAEVAAEGQGRGLDGVVPDPGCAEGWCAVHRAEVSGCIANGCTRACTGGQDCPRGSICQDAVPTGCSPQSQAYCKPGGTAGTGLTCG